MLEKAGCQDVKVDYKAKTATCTVPATVTDEMLSKSVSGKFGAKVQQ
ncbi:MAG: hypothetical protein ACYTGZ_16325 [Planctomycetota bacterium]|jgi:hypothetical protein